MLRFPEVKDPTLILLLIHEILGSAFSKFVKGSSKEIIFLWLGTWNSFFLSRTIMFILQRLYIKLGSLVFNFRDPKSHFRQTSSDFKLSGKTRKFRKRLILCLIAVDYILILTSIFCTLMQTKNSVHSRMRNPS